MIRFSDTSPPMWLVLIAVIAVVVSAIGSIVMVFTNGAPR